MNTNKYKSVVVDIDTYEFIKGMAAEDERAITKTLKNYFYKGVEAEGEECNLDCKLKDGGTPRMERLLEDLRWYRENTSANLEKQYCLDKKEQIALNLVIVALADTIE
mgnify:CR=1 FL=1|jgi:hypothetical protein